MRERAAELADEGRTGDRGREELHGRGARPPGSEDLGRGECAGQERDSALDGPIDQLGIDMRRHEEGRARIDGSFGGLECQHGPRADLECGALCVAGGRPERRRAPSSSGSLRVSSKARTPPRSRPSATSRTDVSVRFRAIATTPHSTSPAGIGGRASVTAGRGRGRARRRAHAAWPAKPRGRSARSRSPARATGDPPERARGPDRSARRRRTRFRRTSS